MIVEEKIGRLAKSGFSKPIRLGMEANAVAFRIVIKNIYTDPIKAIVRELGTNALESHIKAGNLDTPFEVTIPTLENPNFVIRDFGTGLSPDELRNIYAVMFRSDKRDSNDYNGCFGIGSKSPFAYSDNFMLESYVDGLRYIYNCYIDESGTPTIAPIDGCEDGLPTDEPSGVKITIPVASKDIASFERQAKEVYQYFRWQPKGNLNIPKIEYKDLPYTDWKVRRGGGGCNVIMGDVCYKVTIGDKLGNYYGLSNNPIDIYAEIGSVSVDSGRERIVADQKTIEYLKGRFRKIVENCEEYVTKQLEGARNKWELRVKALAIRHTFMSEYAKEITWGGEKHSLVSLCRQTILAGDYTVWRFSPDEKKSCLRSRVEVADCIFVHFDKCTGPHIRCQILANKENKTVYGVKCTSEDFDKIVEQLDISSYATVASKIDRGPVPKRDYTKYRSVVKYDKSHQIKYANLDYWDREEDFDPSEGGYYVQVDRGSVIHNDTRMRPIDLLDVIGVVEKHTTDKIEVYGVTKALKEEFDNSADWINLFDIAKEALEKKWKDAKGNDALYYHYNVEMNTKLSNFMEMQEKLDKQNLLIKKLIEGHDTPLFSKQEIDKALAIEHDYTRVFSKTPYDANKVSAACKTKVDKIVAGVKKADEKYPLLNHIGWGYHVRNNTKLLGDIAHYINSL